MLKNKIVIGLLCMIVQSSQAQVSSASSHEWVGERCFTLDQCIDSAQVYNRELQNAVLELQVAGQQRKEAFTKYFPEISANVTAFYAFDDLIRSDAMGLSELNRGYGATLSALQPIFAGGQICTANKLAKVQEDVSRLQLQLKELDVTEKITENYWKICTLRYNLRTIEVAERQLDAVMQQVQHFVDAGVTTSNALLQVKLRKHELASNRLKLENAEKTLLMLLAQQTGIKDLDIVLPDDDEMVTLPMMYDEVSAVNLRRELALAHKSVEAHRLLVRMERGKYLPTLAVGVMGVNLGMGGLSERVKSMTDTNITNGIALGTLSVPISSWWGGSHAIRRQKLNLQMAENELSDAHENLRIDMTASWNNLIEAYEQIRIAKSSVDESQENLRMQTEQYRSGTSTLTELLDAETLNRKSRDQLSSALAAYQIALVKYEQKIR